MSHFIKSLLTIACVALPLSTYAKDVPNFHLYTGASIEANTGNSSYSGTTGSKYRFGLGASRFFEIEYAFHIPGTHYNEYTYNDTGAVGSKHKVGLSMQAHEVAIAAIWPATKNLALSFRLGTTSWSADLDKALRNEAAVDHDGDGATATTPTAPVSRTANDSESGSGTFYGIGLRLGDEKKAVVLDILQYNYGEMGTMYEFGDGSTQDFDDLDTLSVSFGFEARFL